MLQIPHQLVGAPLGSTVTLECSTEAHPISLNYWTREKDMIHENSKFHADTQRADLPYKSHMTLTIRNVEQACPLIYPAQTQDSVPLETAQFK